MRPKNLLLTLSAVIILLFTASLALAAPIGKVTLVTGKVDVLKSGENLATPVKLGDPVDVGDIYRAKTKSNAEITFNNKNILKIAPATRVEIKEYAADEQKSSQVINLHRGKVQAISGEDFIKKVAAATEGNRFEVHTPNAVAGIRGSNMLVGFSQGKTVVIFIAGHGYLYNPQMPQVVIPVVAGQMSFVVGEQHSPSLPTQAPEGLTRGEGEAFIQVEKVTTEEKATETEAITTASVVTPPAEALITQAAPPTVPTSFTEQDPPPPPPSPQPGALVSGTNFTGTMEFLGSKGTFTGNIPENQPIGTMSASGAYSGSMPTTLEGWLYGTSDKGGAFSGLLAGIQGSLLTRMAAFYVEGGNLSFLTGDAPGTYDGATFAISGSLGKSGSLGTVTLTPNPYEPTLLGALEYSMQYGYPPQFFPSGTPIIISDSGIQITSSPYFRYTVPYLITNEGRRVAVIGNIYEGSYASTTTTALPYLGYARSNEYALGPLFYSHDTANSRFTIDIPVLQSIGYDEVFGPFIGMYSMRYFGKYEGETFRMAGAGTYVAEPASFFGEWGGDFFYYSYWGKDFVYYNNHGVMADAGYGEGLFGGTTPPWSSPASFTAIGQYTLDIPDKNHYLMNSYISSGGTIKANASIDGFTGAIWKDGSATTVGTISDGTIRAFYVSPADATTGRVAAGIMKGTFAGNYYDISPTPMWGISGTLTPTPVLTLNSTDFVDYEYGSMTGGLSGNFGGKGGIYGLDDGNGEILYLYTESPQSAHFGIFNIRFGIEDYPNYYFDKPTGNTPWSAKLGGGGEFDNYGDGYWLADVSAGTWTGTGEITGNIAGKAITPLSIYDMEGRFIGANQLDTETWIGQAIGSYQTATPTDFGGDWYHCTLYNDFGDLAWNSEGEDYGYFGLVKRTDGKYAFLAIGEFTDYGYGMEEHGGPYILSGSMYYGGQTAGRNIEAFTGAIWKKADSSDTSGTIAGYTSAVYYTEAGKVGLIKGPLTGDFYEMVYYEDEYHGMWQVQSGTDGLTTIDKTASLPADFDIQSAAIYYDDSLSAHLAGAFTGGTKNTIFADDVYIETKFITYADSDQTKSLPFGIYNMKLDGYNYEYNYEAKPTDTSVGWRAKIGGDGGFGVNSSDKGYWLANIGGTWTEYGEDAGHGIIDGTLSGKYITQTHLGTIQGPFYGLYTEDGLGDTGGYGTWVGMSAGTYEDTPLAFVTSVGVLEDNGFMDSNFDTKGPKTLPPGDQEPNTITQLTGLLGGTGDIWKGQQNFIMMGRYGEEYKTPIWYMDMASSDPLYLGKEGADPSQFNISSQGIIVGGSSFEGVGYHGGIGGISIGDTLYGKGLAIYIKPETTGYSTGYLSLSDISGTFYTGIGMWKATGNIDAIPMGTTNIEPAYLYDGSPYLHASEFIGSTTGTKDITITESYIEGDILNLTDQPWGIFLADISAKYSSANKNWQAIGGFESLDKDDQVDGYGIITITGTDWSNGRLSGTITGRHIDDSRLNTITGDLIGIYTEAGTNPGSFQAVSLGTSQGTPLTSSLKLSTSDTSHRVFLWRALPGTYYEAEFGQYDGQAFWYEYEYIETVGGKGYGYVEDDLASDGYYEKVYLPNGTMWKMNGDMQITRWDIGGIEEVRKLPAWLDPSKLFAVWYSEWPGIELLEHRSVDSLDARLGMTGYPWNAGGTPVTIIGRYNASDSDYTKPTILTTPLHYGKFYSDYVEGGKTANGAYGVSLGGFIDSTNGVQLAMIGLYTNGSTAGVLRDAQLLKGGLYKDIGMWDAEGTLSATVMKTDFTNPLNNPAGVTIANLAQNVVTTPFELEIAGHLTGDPRSFLTTIMDNTGQTHFIKGQDWGIFTTTMWSGGFGVTSTPISGIWNTQIVGEGQFGVYKDAEGYVRPDYGMMLIPELAGTLSDGVIKASSTGNVGKFMTMTKMGTISDVGLRGVYTQPSSMTPNTLYSWQGVSEGVWKTTDNLTFVSELETSVRNLRHEYDGGYIQESGVVYNYSFNKDDGYGEITFFPDGTHSYTTRIVYEPDAGFFSTPMWEKYTYDNTFSEFTYEKGTYNPSSLGHEFFSDLAVEEGYLPANQQTDWWTMSDIGSISAIMGSVGDLWSATPASPAIVSFLGEYENDYKKPSLFDTEIVSYNITNDTYTTLDGKGAYIGYIGGNEKDGAIEGWLNAIYLKDIGDGKSQAGILSGSFTGQAYDDAEMWQGQGSIYPVSVKNQAMQLSPSGLYDNTYKYYLGAHMYGTFDNGAVISGVNNYSLTYAIYNEPWGIYGLRLTEWAKFEAFETLPTSWAAKVGMMGDFGAYKEVKDGLTSITPDSGYWLADISGTLSTASTTTDGKLSGSLTGKYLSNTRLGTMAGDVYGTYNTDSALQMLSLGTWQGTPLAFVSNMSSNISNTMVEYIGNYSYTGGGSYYYQYYSDNTGYSENHPTLTSSYYPYTYTEYHADGTTVTWGYDANGNPFTESGTWNTTKSLAEIITNPAPPTGETATLVDQSNRLTMNSTGYMNTRIGGIDSLWTGNDVPVTILGMHYTSGYGDRKPEGIWYSEIKSYSITNNTDTTLDGQGAYYGYIGGHEIDGTIGGGIGAIYLKKQDDASSQAGILLGSFTGQAYEEIMMWEGQGTISPPVYLLDKPISYTSLMDNVHVTDLYPGSGTASLIVNDNPINTDSFIYDLHYMALYDASEGSFGVWRSAIGAYGIDPGDSWTASFEYMDSTRINGQYITGATSSNIMTGSVVGYGADLTPPQPATWISVGEAKGTFDPNLTTFQMMAIGPSIETSTYLKLVDANPQALKALNIPTVQVGVATLTGSGNNLTVNMNDVRFFAATNGGKPQVWATQNVNGSYSGAPTPGMPVTLNSTSGGSLTANFTVQQWNANKWLSTVAGSGTLSGGSYTGPTQFKGAAAGTYGITSGQFSGTAAGVAK